MLIKEKIEIVVNKFAERFSLRGENLFIKLEE
jgi:hypothetical protein